MTIAHHSQVEQSTQQRGILSDTAAKAHCNMQNNMIEAQELAVRLEKRTIWRNANFQIKAGEFITVVGPNGAGKSTLLRLLLGLLPHSKGHIQVLGGKPRRGNALIGYVPQ